MPPTQEKRHIELEVEYRYRSDDDEAGISGVIVVVLPEMNFPATESPSDVHLSNRETQVLQGLARGLYDKELAAELGVSLGTVRVYRKRIGDKLRVRGLVPWLLIAWKLGLIDIEPIAQQAMERFNASRQKPVTMVESQTGSANE